MTLELVINQPVMVFNVADFNWRNKDNKPPDLIRVIVSYLSIGGYETNTENIVLGFPKVYEVNETIICLAVVKFVGAKEGVQYFAVKKTKENHKDVWRIIKVSKVMPSKKEDLMNSEDPSFRLFY